jgi:outer membrane protein OmpA-like peptidoglycan-associated protein
VTIPWTGTPVPLAIAPDLEPATIQVPPRSLRVRLTGLLFELDKTLLLPKALKSVRRLGSIYKKMPGAEVLVVGHTDTSGKPAYNQTLSEERADVVAAYLKDDVEAWVRRYHVTQRAWGAREDALMLSALSDEQGPFVAAPGAAPPKAGVERFQRHTNAARGTTLKVDGIPGDQTRTELVRAYMAKDEATLPAGTTLVVHGCGESHPEVKTGDSVALEANRRVEVFFFEDRIDPPAPTKAGACAEYPAWRDGVGETIDLRDVMPSVLAARWERPLQGERAPLALRLLDRALKPCPDLEAVLVLPGGARLFGRSDGSGLLKAEVPAGAPEVTVLFTPPGEATAVRRVVRLGLPPVSDDEGARRRLVHLGYKADADLPGATRLFQTYQGLAASGALDGPTRSKLAELHDGGA